MKNFLVVCNIVPLSAPVQMIRFSLSEFQKQPSQVFLRKGVLKICSKYTGEHTFRSVISIQLLLNLIEIALWHGCSPVNLLHIFRTNFSKNTSGWLFLELIVGVLEKKKNLNESEKILSQQSKVSYMFLCHWNPEIIRSR